MKSWIKIYGGIVSLLVLHISLTLLYTVGALLYYMITNGSEEGFELFLGGQLANVSIFAGVASVLIYVLFYRIRKRNLFTQLRFRKMSWQQLAASIGIGSSFIFLSVILVNLLAQWFPVQFEEYTEMFEMLEQAGIIPLLIAVVIVAPFFEEILFRGVAFQLLIQKHRLLTAAVISGVLFGLYHQNLFQGTFASLLGIVLGLSLIWTGSIWAPIVIHLVNNALSFLIGSSAINEWLTQYPTISLVLMLIMIIGVLPLSIYWLYRVRSQAPFGPDSHTTPG
jgi:membrane protease YdiL (CAAX protease family)